MNEDTFYNWLIALGTVFILCGVWLVGAFAAWRRRRARARGVLPTDVYPGSVEQAIDRLRADEAALEGEVAWEAAHRAQLQAAADAGEPVVHEAELIAFEEFLKASKPQQ